MDYQVNWSKAVRLIIIASIILVSSLILGLFLFQSTLTIVFSVLSLWFWVLCVGIAAFHFSNSVSIRNGVVTHLVFGLARTQKPLVELIEIREEKAALPGTLVFRDGSKISISGIAMGKERNLISYLKKYGRNVQISSYA